MINAELFTVNAMRIAQNDKNYHEFFNSRKAMLSRLGAFGDMEERVYRDNWEDLKQMKRG